MLSPKGRWIGSHLQFINYETCVECVSFCFQEVDDLGQLTGHLEATCTRKIAKLASADGAEIWATSIERAETRISLWQIQQVRRANRATFSPFCSPF